MKLQPLQLLIHGLGIVQIQPAAHLQIIDHLQIDIVREKEPDPLQYIFKYLSHIISDYRS